MEQQVKFIWDFYGSESLGIAKHHVIHLKEYCQNNNLDNYQSDIEELEGGYQAYLILKEPDAITAHGFLKPMSAVVVK